MKRTIDIMTAARAKGVELPGEWWRVIGARSASPSEFYIGPDLELPKNLHHACTVADALCAPGFRAVIEWDGDVFRGEIIHRTRKVGPCVYADAKDAERHLALVAACEAALGIQHGKENAV